MWCHGAWEAMPRSVIVNAWKKSDLLPDTFWEGEGMGRMEVLETAEQVVLEQYAATDKVLSDFRGYFPGIMTAAEYAESLPGEHLVVEQPPTATEFVEQILALESSSSDDEEGEGEPKVTEEQYEAGLQAVEKLVQQNAEVFGLKTVSSVFFCFFLFFFYETCMAETQNILRKKYA